MTKFCVLGTNPISAAFEAICVKEDKAKSFSCKIRFSFLKALTWSSIFCSAIPDVEILFATVILTTDKTIITNIKIDNIKAGFLMLISFEHSHLCTSASSVGIYFSLSRKHRMFSYYRSETFVRKLNKLPFNNSVL